MGDSGIYGIRNLINQKVYVGRSIRLKKRKAVHFRSLRKGTHRNGHLQRAWDKYGEDAFEFVVLCEEEDRTKLAKLESRFARELGATDRNRGYNIHDPLPVGHVVSEETRQKLSEIATERYADPRERQRMSQAQKARDYKPSVETRKKMSEARARRPPISEETRRRLRAAHKGRKRSEATRKKISVALKGHAVSEETRRKISEANLRFRQKG